MSELTKEGLLRLRREEVNGEGDEAVLRAIDMALRTHDAEAECERLRDALNDHHQWARTHGHEMGLGYLNSWLDKKTRKALATPPPEGEYSIRCVICDASVRPEDGGLCDKHKYDEQAHGDAMAAFERLAGGFSSTVEQDKGIVRKALTASGVPEEVRRLPETAAQKANRKAVRDTETLRKVAQAHRANKGAPDGWVMVPVEPTPQMLDATWDHDEAKIESHNTRNHRIWSAMIASAPAVRDWLTLLEREDLGLVPISVPTGGDDFDVQWTVVSYHMAEPKERVIGRGPTPRDALSDAVPF